MSQIKKFFSLQFTNTELEHQYQCHMQKHMLKIVKYYILILIAAQIISVADQFYNKKYFLGFMIIPALIFNIVAYKLIIEYPQIINYYKYYLGIISLIASSYQIAIVQFQLFELTDPQCLVFFDLIHQLTLLFNFGQSHNLTSLLYLYFLITRFYVYISVGQKSFSIIFLIFGILFFLDQYYKAIQRRKQFLKGRKNKALEYLIKEFIDDSVCIIQKDQINIRLEPIIFNRKFEEITTDFNQLLYQLKIPQFKSTLQNYLYSTEKDKETLLCNYQHDIYEVTYSKFILKNEMFFIRMKKICIQNNQLIDYKKICQYYQKKLTNFQGQSFQVKRFVDHLKIKAFMFCFNKYFALYKCNFQIFSYVQIMQLLEKKQFKVISNVQKPLETDQDLLNLLLNLISDIMSERIVSITQKNIFWELNFGGQFRKGLQQINYVLQFIDKILFLIGDGSSQLEDGLIKLVIINNKHRKFE